MLEAVLGIDEFLTSSAFESVTLKLSGNPFEWCRLALGDVGKVWPSSLRVCGSSDSIIFMGDEKACFGNLFMGVTHCSGLRL